MQPRGKQSLAPLHVRGPARLLRVSASRPFRISPLAAALTAAAAAAGPLIALFPLAAALSIVVLVFAVILGWVFPNVLVWALVLSVPITAAPSGQGILSRLYPAVALAFVLEMTWLTHYLVTRRLRASAGDLRLMYPLWGLLLVGMISGVTALLFPDPRVVYSFPASGIGPQVTIVGQSAITATACILPAAVASILTQQGDISRLINILLCVGPALALATIAGALLHTGSAAIAEVIRPAVGQLSGGALGVIFIELVPLNTIYILRSSPGPQRARSLSAMVVVLVGVALTFSRITWLAVAAELLAVGLFWKPARTTLAAAMLVVVGTLLAVTTPFLDPVLGFFDPSRVYGVERLRIWRDAWDIYVSHPILGVGMGNYQFFDRSLPVDMVGAGVTHNQYLTVLAEVGPIGLALLVTFVLVLSINLWRWSVSSSDSRVRDLSLSLFSVTIGFILLGFAGDSFVISTSLAGGTLGLSVTSYFWVLLGLLLAQRRLLMRTAAGDT